MTNKEYAYQMLDDIGVPVHLKGYEFIAECIAIKNGLQRDWHRQDVHSCSTTDRQHVEQSRTFCQICYRISLAIP